MCLQLRNKIKITRKPKFCNYYAAAKLFELFIAIGKPSDSSRTRFKQNSIELKEKYKPH